MTIWIVGDTETTGVKTTDKVVEIAWKQVNPETLEVITEGYSLINPQMDIPVDSSAVHGIMTADVANAPTIEEYMAGEGKILTSENVILVFHNANFDVRFLQPYLHETTQSLCTLKCARQLFPDSPNHKQATLALYLGYQVDRSKAHSADGDLDVLMFIIKHLCEKRGVALPGLLEVQCEARRNTTFPFGKHKGKKPSEVDVGYCQWALKTLENLDADLRAALEARTKPQTNR